MGDRSVTDVELPSGSPYDDIAGIYDAWSASVTEDVGFYVEEAARDGGPVVELGVGTGRIAVPVARAGVRVIGIDSSREMLEVCRRSARAAGVEQLLDLRLGSFLAPPIAERVSLVTCPFRTMLHLTGHAQRARALRTVRSLLVPGGRFIFDVFAPSAEDIAETHGRWLEREPGIWERADWDVSTGTLMLGVRRATTETWMRLAWLPAGDWLRLLRVCGFAVEDVYGWFDRRPFTGGEDTVWVARRPAER